MDTKTTKAYFEAVENMPFKMPVDNLKAVTDALETRDKKLVQAGHTFESEFRKGFLLAQDIVEDVIKSVKAVPNPPTAHTEELSPLQKIEFWTRQYEFSFQFWGKAGNNVFINRDDVEIASFGGRDTIDEILLDTIAWCEKANPRFNYSK